MRRVAVGLALAVVVAGGCTSPATAPSSPRFADADIEARTLFIDRASDVGLDFVHTNGATGDRYMVEVMGAGSALFDFDNDGDLDAYLLQGAKLAASGDDSGPLRDRLFRNELVETGSLQFTDVTDASGLKADGYGMGVAVGDYNNDGHADVYVTNFGSNQFFRNDGDGTFTDVTPASGTDDARWSTGATFLDYDRDGWLDLFVGNYVDFTLASHKTCYSAAGAPDYCGPTSFEPYPNRLFHNEGDGTFTDVSVSSGIAQAHGGLLGVVAADFNGDGWADLYVANDARANQLWTNQGNGRFENTALLSGVAYNGRGVAEGSMGVDAPDIDNDGDEDLFMTHIATETNTLFRQAAGGFFEDATMAAGLGLPSRGLTGFGTAWLDYDGDGRLDLLVVNGGVQMAASSAQVDDMEALGEPNQLFRNIGGGQFEEVTEQAGESFALLEVSRGATAGDVDNDGDLDVLVTNDGGPVRLLVNQSGEGAGTWLGLRLLERPGGRDAYGARVGCTLTDGRTLWRRVRATAGYCSSNDPRVLCGAGPAARVQSLQVDWPDGSRERWDVASFTPNRYHNLTRGTGEILGAG